MHRAFAVCWQSFRDWQDWQHLLPILAVFLRISAIKTENSLENFYRIQLIREQFSREFGKLSRQSVLLEFKVGGLSVSCQSWQSPKRLQTLYTSAFCQSVSLYHKILRSSKQKPHKYPKQIRSPLIYPIIPGLQSKSGIYFLTRRTVYETSIAFVTFSFGSDFGMVMVNMPSSTLAEILSRTTSSGSV